MGWALFIFEEKTSSELSLTDSLTHTSYLSPAPHAVQVSKFSGWCQKVPQITVIFVVGGGGTTNNGAPKHHHNHTLPPPPPSKSPPPVAHLQHHQNQLCRNLRCFVAKSVVSQFTRFLCQILELKMLLVSNK